jgi:2-methylaconitate cis-trans-isomerase PrpF
LADLGTIVFAIAGQIGDDLPVSISFPETADFTTFQYFPTQQELLTIQDGTISINRIDDIDIVWRAIEAGVRQMGITDVSQLSKHFQKSFEELCEEAARPVYLNNVRDEGPSILTEIIERLGEQIERYRDALNAYMEDY